MKYKTINLGQNPEVTLSTVNHDREKWSKGNENESNLSVYPSSDNWQPDSFSNKLLDTLSLFTKSTIDDDDENESSFEKFASINAKTVTFTDYHWLI